jgi:hypothetical protein
MIIAQNPRIMMRSLIKGTAITSSAEAYTGFFCSIQLKKRNNKKAMLHINVNFDKNLNNPISINIIFSKTNLKLSQTM